MSTALATLAPPHALEPRRARIFGLSVTAMRERDAAERLVQSAALGRGEWAITANLDHLRRYRHDACARRLLDSADVVVADGTPLVWASRIAGTPLPERVAGSDMVLSISEAAGRAGVPLFLLGGDPRVAERAGRVLRERYPELLLAGTLCPPFGFHRDERELELIERTVREAAPGIVMVALGFPKQDLLIERLRWVLPGATLLGVGIGLSFVAGERRRCPAWTARLGLEWCHRLLAEPRRLAGRYLRGLPFAAQLLLAALVYRALMMIRRGASVAGWGWEGRA